METTWVVSRIELYQLWQAHPRWSARQFAEEVGMSESWVKKWRKRFQETSSIVASSFQSHSRATKTAPRQVHPSVQEAILELRDSLSAHYHRRAGAKLILYHLHSDPIFKQLGHRLPTSARTIYRILKSGGRLPKKVPYIHIPIARPPVMEEWEMDWGETPHLGGEEGAEFLAVIDRGSSILVRLAAMARYHADTAILAVSELFLLNGLPKRLRFDRDTRWVGSWNRNSYPSPFIRFLRCLGVEPVICPPRRPDLKPFVERVIRTVKEECLWVERPQFLTAMNTDLDNYLKFYNEERPHQGLSCRNRPPLTAFPTIPTLPTLPDEVDPDHWLQFYHGRAFQRHVNANGSVMIDRYRYYLGKDYAGQRVAFHLNAHQGRFQVQRDGRVIALFEVQGLHRQKLPFQTYLNLMMKEAESIEQFRRNHWQKTNWEDYIQ